MTKFNDAIGFSKLDCFRACPQKFRFQFIDKIPQPGSAAMERGSKIHDEAEAAIFVLKVLQNHKTLNGAWRGILNDHFALVKRDVDGRNGGVQIRMARGAGHDVADAELGNFKFSHGKIL